MTFEEAYTNLKEKFASGNDVSVGRATVLAEEWEAIKKYLDDARPYLHVLNEMRRIRIKENGL